MFLHRVGFLAVLFLFMLELVYGAPLTSASSAFSGIGGFLKGGGLSNILLGGNLFADLFNGQEDYR